MELKVVAHITSKRYFMTSLNNFASWFTIFLLLYASSHLQLQDLIWSIGSRHPPFINRLKGGWSRNKNHKAQSAASSAQRSDLKHCSVQNDNFRSRTSRWVWRVKSISYAETSAHSCQPDLILFYWLDADIASFLSLSNWRVSYLEVKSNVFYNAISGEWMTALFYYNRGTKR